MPDVTIASTATQLLWQGGDAPTFIIEAAGPTLTPEGVPVNNGGGPFRNEWATTVNVGGYVVVPAVSLPSGVSYFAYFQKPNAYDSISRIPFSVFGPTQPFYVPDDTPTTWDEIDTARGGGLPAVSGNRTVSGDLLVEGDLQVNGSITSNDTLDVDDDVNVSGVVTAQAFVGSGAGLTGITGATGGVSNTGSTTVGADTDADDVGVIDLQTRNLTRARVNNDGSFELFNPLRLKGYTTAQIAALTMLERQVAYDTDKKRVVFYDGAEALALDVSPFVNVRERGLVGDGSTDDTAAFQTLFDNIGTVGDDATLLFPSGVYIIGGALQDTGASNSQLVLPKRNTLADQLTVRLLGVTPAPTFGRGDRGAIIQSTLAAGTGSILGVKNNASSGGIAESVEGFNYLTLHVENLTFRAVENPTISGLDLRYLPQIVVKHVKVDVDFAALPIAQPTTATSFGILTPLNNVPSVAVLEDVQVTGFYYGYQWGELCSGNNVTANWCVYVAQIPQAEHALHFGRVLRTECIRGLKFTGGQSQIYIAQYDVDNNTAVGAWYNFIDHITDPSNYAHGKILWNTSIQDIGTGNVFVEDGGFYLWTEQLGNRDLLGSTASPFVQCHNTANISIANATWPAAGVGNVTFNTNLSTDRYALHSESVNTDRFVCKKKGLTLLTFEGQFAANSTGTRRVRIYKHSAFGGGSEILLSERIFPALSGVPTPVYAEVSAGGAHAGDYFYVQVWQDSGGALNLLTANYNSPYATFRIMR